MEKYIEIRKNQQTNTLERQIQWLAKRREVETKTREGENKKPACIFSRAKTNSSLVAPASPTTSLMNLY